MEHLGREVFVAKNILTDEQCTKYINLFECCSRYRTEQSEKNGEYTTTTKYEVLPLISDLSEELTSFSQSMCVNLVKSYQRNINTNIDLGTELELMRIMKFRAHQRDQFDIHFDANGTDHYRTLALIFYLNTVHEGGELFLPDPCEPITIKPEMGNVALVPTGWTHRHYVHPPISNDRYSLICFLRYPSLN